MNGTALILNMSMLPALPRTSDEKARPKMVLWDRTADRVCDVHSCSGRRDHCHCQTVGDVCRAARELGDWLLAASLCVQSVMNVVYSSDYINKFIIFIDLFIFYLYMNTGVNQITQRFHAVDPFRW
jgi:hypothetical protein